MVVDAAPVEKAPPLGPALVAMTGLQALVALAVFAPGVLAPQTGLGAGALSAFATTVCAVGAVTSLWGGALADRYGPFLVAIGAACVVAVAMLILAGAHGPAALLIAGVLIGLAFGPETPASSALLGRLARPADRPLIFSVRQTGNQAGAMLGSLSLPAIAALWSPQAGFAAVMIVAFAALAAFAWLRPRYDTVGTASVSPPSLRAALALLAGDRRLARLALASMPYSAMQMALNTFFVSFAVGHLDLAPAAAGALLAVAQGAGLIGRVGFGVVVGRGIPALTLIAGVGVAMALAAIVIAGLGSALPVWALAALVALFGLTASGWNGVFLAEVARLAPATRVGEATGAVLMASYCGLVIGPLLVGATAALAGLAASFIVLAALALAGAVVVAGARS